MRTLVVAREYPWPANSGSRLRLLTTSHGLGGLGPTDLFSITSDERTDIDEPDGAIGFENVGRVTVRSDGARLGRLARQLMPAALPLADRDRVCRAL